MSIFFRVASGTFLRTYVGLYVGFLLTDLSEQYQVPPTSEKLDQTSTLQEDLYRHRPPEGEIIPILVQSLSIKDGPSEVGEIAAAVRKLRSGREGGPSGMKAKHLRAWLRVDTR